LPQTLYKYLDLQYAESLIARGVVRFSSLSWFLDFEDNEDEERGDAFEGRRKYFPVNGITVTKQHEPPFTIPDGSFQSAARDRDSIFVLSTSVELSQALAEKFRRPEHVEMACVEICDPIAFAARLEASLKKRSPIQHLTFFYDRVTYYSFEDDPNPIWALPHRLVMHKQKRFDDQKEYRFTFGTKKQAFKPYRIEAVIEQEGFRRPKPRLDPKKHCTDLVLGPMAGICRVVPSTELARSVASTVETAAQR